MKMEKEKNVVKITYKFVQKSEDTKTNKQMSNMKNSSSKKVLSKKSKMDDNDDDGDDDDDDDDIPLIKINCKNNSKPNASNIDDFIAVVYPKKPVEKLKKSSNCDQQMMSMGVEPKIEPSVKVKPSYCKICFIKMSNDEEALEHERCHDTFRKSDGRWTCVICSDQFPFYCDLLNHFLNHRDILELYSVYLSNLDTSLGKKKQQAYSDDENEDVESELKEALNEIDLKEENKDDGDNSIVDNNLNDNGRIENIDVSNKMIMSNNDIIEINHKINEMNRDDMNGVCNNKELESVILKIEPNDDIYNENNLSDTIHNYGENVYADIIENVKEEAIDVEVKKEETDDNNLMDDDTYNDIDNVDYDVGFHENDSDEDKPLSSCIVKKTKVKKKKKKKKMAELNLENVIKKSEKKPKKLKKKKVIESDGCLSDEQVKILIPKKSKRRACFERGNIPLSRFYRMQKCDHCDFETSKRTELEMHAAEHVEGEPILCELCDYRCKIERQLLTHKRVVHEGYKYACDICDYTAKTLNNLRGHKLVHGERKIGCNICGKMFRRKNNLNDHLKTHSDERPYKCSYCPKTFKDPKGYKLHLLGAHNIVQRLSCGYCNFETDSRQELNIHKASLHHSKYMRLLPVKNDEGDVTQTIIFACDVCDYVANSEANLKSHLVVHEEKRLSCEVCGKLFRRIGNLIEHQRSHSEKRPYACPVCPSKAFKDNKSYRRHIARIHDMIEMLKCDKCNYKTHTKGLMRYHAMKHSGQLRFQCSECSYACMTRHTMQRHKLVHDTVMPVYSCDMCNFRSVSDRAVKRHKQVHVEK